MFSTKGQEVKQGGGVMKSLQPGVVYAHIYDASLRTSNKGDKKTLELILETPPIKDFEGWAIDKNNPDGPKFAGQSSRVSATIWTDQFNEPNVSKNEIMYKLTSIAAELGMRDKIDSISAGSLEEWVAKALDIVRGEDMFFFLKGTEEEYNGKTIVKLSLPKYKFASTDADKLDKYDKTNVYHYKALPATTAVKSFEPVNDDFDM